MKFVKKNVFPPLPACINISRNENCMKGFFEIEKGEEFSNPIYFGFALLSLRLCREENEIIDAMDQLL